MSRLKGRTSDSLNHSARDTQRKTLTKAVLKGFWPKGGWRSVAKGKERYSALCRATRSVGALVTLGQGRQGLKVPEMSKIFKN
jgi:hypothetical protein